MAAGDPERAGNAGNDAVKDPQIEDDGMPSEIDFSKGVRGLNHIPPGAKVFMPASIERSVWEYFLRKGGTEAR
jgi:hypothetical protein